MTVISEPVASIAGADDFTAFEFAAVVLRENHAGTGLVTPRPVRLVASDGVLTTPELDPGPAIVRIGQRAYRIEIPDWPEPVRLMPLIEAGLPVQPSETASPVINAGGIRRVIDVTVSEYAALDPPDPDTLYIVFPDDE
ncbi:hypothetical protein [Nocardia farcinica]|uniref:hypothetical protein n=1 Tax=Nocardia farcinica TaxID=37329 RepID=UPI001893CABE|nr:hypothetical protein [Nocardia farcinica]MBF6189410.1 hypothetical protein [Nocardia farcinica]